MVKKNFTKINYLFKYFKYNIESNYFTDVFKLKIHNLIVFFFL